jgi:hypothetical protein
MSKLKKHTLLLENDIDFELIGVCSPHNDYRIAWGINKLFRIDLAKCDDTFDMYSKKGQLLSQHSYYLYVDREDGTEWYLVKNKCNGAFLIPEKNQIDHFILLRNNVLLDADDVQAQLKNIPSIVASFTFDPASLASAQLIHFE